jgi:hypothetical protein
MDTKGQWAFTTCTLRGSAILAHIRSTLVKVHCEVVPGMAQSGHGQMYISSSRDDSIREDRLPILVYDMSTSRSLPV